MKFTKVIKSEEISFDVNPYSEGYKKLYKQAQWLSEAFYTGHLNFETFLDRAKDILKEYSLLKKEEKRLK